MSTDEEILRRHIVPILDGPGIPSEKGRRPLGRSRDGRPLHGYVLGSGTGPVSCIAGCHADEPVGPAMLDRLVAYLQGLPADHELLSRHTWRLVPHTNPDGEARNAAWTESLGPPITWARKEDPVAVDLGSYLRHVVRETPGDDLEFGFPRHPEDDEARPEARAIAAFLAEAESYLVHGSFHGMAFAAGPWFLIEKAWIDRTAQMRRRLRHDVEVAGYEVHDIDRGGEKGFHRISRGFTTRPDSRAMAAHFEALGDQSTADLFRPSSMEYVRTLGGDPLTLVSEMPLFILPRDAFPTEAPIRPPASLRLRRAGDEGPGALDAAIRETGMKPMPLRHQMFFQLSFLSAALETATSRSPAPDPARGH